MKTKVTNNTPLGVKQANELQYKQFYSECKEMKKSKDPVKSAQGKVLEKCYRMFQNYGVPFETTKFLFPKLCNEISTFTDMYAKAIKGRDKNE
jgi:hypothetical protein